VSQAEGRPATRVVEQSKHRLPGTIKYDNAALAWRWAAGGAGAQAGRKHVVYGGVSGPSARGFHPPGLQACHGPAGPMPLADASHQKAVATQRPTTQEIQAPPPSQRCV
jgi:hypothetical protein